MTQQERQERDFFAEKIKSRIWRDGDTEKMLDFLDPVWPNMTPLEEAKHLSQRLLEFSKEFEEWQTKQPKSEEKLPPMTDAELEALANLL